MRVEALTQAVCDLALSFGEGGGSSKVRIHVMKLCLWLQFQTLLQCILGPTPPPPPYSSDHPFVMNIICVLHYLPLLPSYTQMSRPFGVALLIAGYDDKGPQLFFSDPR